MGSSSSKKWSPDAWCDLKYLGVWKREPIRVRSAKYALTEWDDIGDKNADYYKGNRMTVIDPALYAIPVCKTHPHGTWWAYDWQYVPDPKEKDSKEKSVQL